MPLEKHYFSEPFASQLRAFCEERARREANPDEIQKPATAPGRQGNPYMDRKAAMQPPTASQIAYLKRLGAKSLPGSKFEASHMIDELVKKK